MIIVDPVYGFSGVPAIYENATIDATAPGGILNYDVLSQSVLQCTSNPTSNWTLNVRGNSGAALGSLMVAGQALTVTLIVTQGVTAYYSNAFTIDGVSYTPKWQGSAPTAGVASKTEIYTYAIIKTASEYNVFATKSVFS